MHYADALRKPFAQALLRLRYSLIRYKKIFLGGPCNNNCLHCPPSYRNSTPTDFSTIEQALGQRDSDSIVLFGGEPTLRNDLLRIVADARSSGYRRIKIMTNGRALSNVHYLEQLIRAGCSLFEITLWGSNAGAHESLSRAPGSFWETITGLRNLAEVPYDKFICIRIPVCRETLGDLEQCVATALNLGAHRIILSMQDARLSILAAIPHISNGINISIFNRVWILTEGIPFCFMQGLEHHISEVYTGWETIYQRTYQKGRHCSECICQEICPGVDVLSAKKLGSGDILPVKAGRVFEDIKALYD